MDTVPRKVCVYVCFYDVVVEQNGLTSVIVKHRFKLIQSDLILKTGDAQKSLRSYRIV